MKSIAKLSTERLLGILTILYLFSLLLNLGVQPVFLEEPRRALIAMEMVENQNYIVPTQLGEYYYKKPPVFNWILIASARLFGDFTPWALRLPTVLSTILAGLLLYLVGRRYVSHLYGWTLALLFCTGGAVYYYFSLIGEIDLFYTLVTMACFFSIFHFQQQQQWLGLFGSAYALAAIGLLTKGLPSVPFLGLSLVGWLVYTRDWLKLFTWQHLAGIVLFVLIIGGYALTYDTYNPIGNYFNELFSESVNRTAVENSVVRFLNHLLVFPLDTIKDSLPGVLLLLFLIRKDWKMMLRSHPLVAFSVLAFLLNFSIYWLSPGARQRYIYMLYPFLLIIGLYAFNHKEGARTWVRTAFRVLVWIAIAVAIPASLALNFIPAFDFLDNRWGISILISLCFATIGWLYYNDTGRPLIWLLFAGVMFRLLFDLAILPQRAFESAGQVNRDKAEEIHEIVQDAPLYVYKDGRFSYTTVYYLNRLRKQALRQSDELQDNAYYIVPDSILPSHDPLVELEFSGVGFKLIRK
jgi:4-amino-4-deoxy-L-arabinose transferase-like glycosyltransferase